MVVLTSLAVLIAVAYLGLKKNIDLDDMEVFETPHFSIHHEGLAPGTLNDIQDRMESKSQPLRDFFGLGEAAKGTIVVYSDIDRFQRAYLGLILSVVYGDWAAGGAYQHMVLLTSPEQPGSDQTYESMLDILLHEYVHTLVYSINDRADIWLDEGLATYLSGQEDELPETLPDFDAMESQSMGDFVDHNGYAVGRGYVEYLVETYGSDQVVQLVRTNDYEAQFGKSKRKVHDEWVESVGDAEE